MKLKTKKKFDWNIILMSYATLYRNIYNKLDIISLYNIDFKIKIILIIFSL